MTQTRYYEKTWERQSSMQGSKRGHGVPDSVERLGQHAKTCGRYSWAGACDPYLQGPCMLRKAPGSFRRIVVEDMM